MNEFLEIEYDEKGRKFLLEVYADGKEEIKNKIKIEKNTQGKKKKQKIKYMDLNENDYLGIQITKSYARINSKELMSLRASCLKLNLGKEAIKYPTKYNENEDHLVILTGKGA